MEKLKYLPVLMYHNVIEKKNAKVWNNFCVELPAFEKQMDYLVENGYTCLNFEDLENIIKGTKECPKKPIMITFDDSYCDTVNNVVPRLAVRNMKSIFSVVTGYIGKNSSWEREVDGTPTITEEQIKKYAGPLLSFESHSEGHIHLTRHSVREVEKELADSKKKLETLTGQKVRAVFYPYGSNNENVRSYSVKAGYMFGVAIASSNKTVIPDPLEIRRVYVKPTDSLLDFKRKISPWYLRFRGFKEYYKLKNKRSGHE